jgi:hypothetical protein
MLHLQTRKRTCFVHRQVIVRAVQKHHIDKLLTSANYYYNALRMPLTSAFTTMKYLRKRICIHSWFQHQKRILDLHILFHLHCVIACGLLFVEE